MTRVYCVVEYSSMIRSAPRPFARRTQAKITFVSEGAAAYFKREGRDFPWRSEPDPYRRALAELLWQKTHAKNVVSTYLDEPGDHDATTRLRQFGFSTKRARSYAARAIECLGFGKPIGIVDANVARVLRRIFGIRIAEIGTADAHADTFQRYADAVATVSPDARATNFGLLDLATAVCVRRPKCGECPMAPECHYAKTTGHPSS